VPIYDAVNAYQPGTQPEFYLGVAEEVRAETVVDLGCGTGIITLEFARRGYRTIGVDPSPLMLEAAQQKPGAECAQWVLGGAGELGTPGADLAIMSGHVAQFILDDADWLQALAGIREALGPGDGWPSRAATLERGSGSAGPVERGQSRPPPTVGWRPGPRYETWKPTSFTRLATDAW
jgi:SAM-dependent methyltransferase